MNVPVGLATKAGITTAIGAFASAVIIYLTGDHTAQQVTAVEAAGVGLVTLLAVKLGRYLQSLKSPLLDPFLGGKVEAPVGTPPPPAGVVADGDTTGP